MITHPHHIWQHRPSQQFSFLDLTSLCSRLLWKYQVLGFAYYHIRSKTMFGLNLIIINRFEVSAEFCCCKTFCAEVFCWKVKYAIQDTVILQITRHSCIPTLTISLPIHWEHSKHARRMTSVQFSTTVWVPRRPKQRRTKILKMHDMCYVNRAVLCEEWKTSLCGFTAWK